MNTRLSSKRFIRDRQPLRQSALRTQDVHTWLVCFTGGLEWSFSPSNGWICGASYPGSFSRSPRSVRLNSSSNSNLRQFQHPSCLALACTAHTVCLSHLQPVPCQINSNQIFPIHPVSLLTFNNLLNPARLFISLVPRQCVCLLVASKLYSTALLTPLDYRWYNTHLWIHMMLLTRTSSWSSA